MMRKNPERVAWLVISSAFVVFLTLCASIPLGIRYYLLNSTTPKQATLEVISGTIRVHETGSTAPIAVTKSIQLFEGSNIETDENSRGIITFLDGSTATLFTSTQITLREMRVPTFSWSIEPIRIVIDQTRGRTRIGAGPPILQGSRITLERSLEISTPHLSSSLAEGSYAVEVTTDASQVSVRDGTASVTAQERTVTVILGQRTVVRRDEPPLPPLPAAQDLIANGDFKDPRSRGWNDIIEFPSISISPAGSLSNPTIDNRVWLNIKRNGSNQTSAITGVIQPISKEVSDYRSLRLLADVRLHIQSLSGGGVLGSEYPLILRLKYRDVYGSEAEWVHGFYFQNATNNPTINGELITQDVLFPFESSNLFDVDPRPFYVTSLQVYASGWDYDAYVSGIRLIVE